MIGRHKHLRLVCRAGLLGAKTPAPSVPRRIIGRHKHTTLETSQRGGTAVQLCTRVDRASIKLHS